MSKEEERKDLKLYIDAIRESLKIKYNLVFQEDRVEKLLDELDNSNKSLVEKKGEIDNIKNDIIAKLHATKKKKAKEQTSFSDIKKTINVLRNKFNANGLKLYISGGTVPYLISGEDSNRKHGDIDTVCQLEDMNLIRQVLKDNKMYVEEDDSMTQTVNGRDFGLETIINGVRVGIYPFLKTNYGVIQYSYDSENKYCKSIKVALESLDDFVTTYQGADKSFYDTMTLEFIRKTKEAVGREKDIYDIAKIDKIGYDKERYNRLTLPYDSKIMRAYEVTDDVDFMFSPNASIKK